MAREDVEIGELLEAVAGLDRADRNHIREFLAVLRADQSNGVTPIEHAIIDMAEDCARYHEAVASPEGAGKWRFGLDDLRRIIDDAEGWLKSGIESARHIARLYPFLLEPEGDDNAAA